ncbi:MAG: hypothetical protein JNK56_12935 [Myxococcales bacterium]|nr:hypothetical protein [Myxococcales bacterium]
MRTHPSLVLALVLAACDPGPGPDLGDEPDAPDAPDAPDTSAPRAPGGAPLHTLELPAVLAASHELLLYTDLDGDHASVATELHYGLHASYPRAVTVLPGTGLILAPECQPRPGDVVWHTLTELDGDAAGLTLAAGALAVDLRAEGTVTALLTGELQGQSCTLPGGLVTTVPLAQRIVLRVDQVAGFTVEQFHQQLGDCPDRVVLPADAPLWAPTARPFNARAELFAPINAPTPVGITLRSPGALTAGADPWQLIAQPGVVTIAVDTTLPVRGLGSFTVIGPDALTSVAAALYLKTSASKGTVSEPIADGGSYPLFFPDQPNTVELHVDAATSELGKLCANLPAAWFAVSTTTPARCDAPAASDDPLTSFIPIARIRAPGECRLAVQIPGTTHRWTTHFRTTD